MPNFNKTSNSANIPAEYYDKKLVETIHEEVQLEELGAMKTLPKNSGDTIKWLTYAKMSAATTALTEGVTPTEASATTANITADISQYGDWIGVSDLTLDQAIDPVLKDLAELQGHQAALTVDTLCRTELDSALPDQFANDSANLAATGSNDVLTAKEILKAVITMKKNSVRPHSGGFYVAVVHPACLGDLMNDTNVGSWVDVNKYVGDGRMQIMKGEAGKLFQCRFLESANINSTTSGTESSARVYANFVLGKDAFGVVKLDGRSVQTFIKEPGSAGAADPLNQLATTGWKVQFVAKYLGNAASNPDRGVSLHAGSKYAS